MLHPVLCLPHIISNLQTIVVRFFLKHYFLLIFQGYKVLTFSFLLKYNFLGTNFRDTFAQSWVYQMINSLILVNVNKSANLQNSMFGNYIKSLKANMLFCKSVCWAHCLFNQFAFGLLTKICKLPSSLIFLLISSLSYLWVSPRSITSHSFGHLLVSFIHFSIQ